MIVLFTGGGTAGHIVPNLPLIQRLVERGHEVHYAGSGAAMELDLLQGMPLTYHRLPTGKLRRYLSLENLKDVFRVLAGVIAGYRLIGRIRPNVVFSKGGFVSIPAVLGAALHKIPVIAHESDRSPGLANRIAHHFASHICTTFPDTQFGAGALKKVQILNTGLPIRRSLLQGDRQRGLTFLGFAVEAVADRPVLLVVGGSQGARRLNALIREHLDFWLTQFHVVHLCGGGQLDGAVEGRAGYRQFEFLREPMGDVLAAADLLISRAGATSMYEWMALRKPCLYVPLPLSASRGDQIENAQWALERELCEVLAEDALNRDATAAALQRLLKRAGVLKERIAQAFPSGDATESLCALIEQVGGG